MAGRNKWHDIRRKRLSEEKISAISEEVRREVVKERDTTMTPEEFVDNIRQEIREDGFMSGARLAGVIYARAKEFEINVDGMEIITMLPCEDIRIVEYANWLTKDYRRKDLFYFIPVSGDSG